MIGTQIGLYFLIEGHASLLTYVIVLQNNTFQSNSTVRSKMMEQHKMYMECCTSADFSSVVLPEEHFLFNTILE